MRLGGAPMKGRWQTHAGHDQAEGLHVHTAEVWDTQYIQSRMICARPITLSVRMSVVVYLVDEVAHLCSSINVRLYRCENDHLWDSLMVLLSPYISDDDHSPFGNDKQRRYTLLWSDRDPWEVREAVEEAMKKAVDPLMASTYRVHKTTSVPTFDVIVDQLLIRLPHLLALARTMVAPSGTLDPWRYVPRRGYGAREPLISYQGVTGLRMLTVWRRYRMRSFNKLLRALLKVRIVQCSWEEHP